jgi:Pyridoxamine 5'-phosphate oxidase
MATRTSPKELNSEAVTKAVSDDGGRIGPRLTEDQVWQAIAKASFAILGYVTPSGDPRSSGVMYKATDRRLYVAVAPDSWKAKHIAACGRVAMTVPVRRGGVMSLLAPIPPATISFHGSAIVHPAGSPEARAVLEKVLALLPADRRASASIIEVVPQGAFVTYGLGVSLMKMRDPATARGRVSVTREG